MSAKDAKAAVSKILDQAKAQKRTALTAPEGKLICDAYGIAVPKEGLAKTAAEAAKLAGKIGFPVVLKIVSPEILHKTEAGGVIVGVKTAPEAQKGLRRHRRQRQEIRPQGQDRRRPGAADGRRRPRGHHRRRHRSELRQAGRLRHGRRAGRGAERRDLPPGAGYRARTRSGMIDGIKAAEILKGVRGGEARRPQCPRRADRERLQAGRRFSRDRRARPQSGLRLEERRGRGRRADHCSIGPRRSNATGRRKARSSGR